MVNDCGCGLEESEAQVKDRGSIKVAFRMLTLVNVPS